MSRLYNWHRHGGIGREAFLYACEKLKELARPTHAKNVLAGTANERGTAVYEAIEALPDTRKFDALTQEQQDSLIKFIDQTEISYLADDTLKLIEEKFPQLKTPTTSC